MNRGHEIALVGVIVLLAAAPQGALAAPDEAPRAAPAGADTKTEALAHFERGKTLRDEGAWEPALAEFLVSRGLFPTGAATLNAAGCLKKLRRYDEALDLLEELLRTSGVTLPPDQKETAQRGVAELRALIGTIDVAGAEPGATIVIDGRERGEYPALAALRVGAGSHLVRVSKPGFEPFEARVEVAGGQLARVEARLRALTKSGRLHVAEQGNKALFVVVDGSVVGKTPWDGQLAIGSHVVLLRGEADLGTPPVSVSIELDQTTPLTLSAEALTARLRVEPVPVNASVAIDAVTVGRGVWEGRLRAGAHRIEVAAPGFLPWTQQVSIGRGKQRVLPVPLQRDPTSPFSPKLPRRPRFIVELGAAFAHVPSFGGAIVGGCTGDCSLSAGIFGEGILRGGYELGSGLGFGVTVGYLTATKTTTGRSTTLQPVGLPAPDAGVVDDVIRLRGLLVGTWVGWSIFNPIPIHFRLGGGVLSGSIEDARAGRFAPNGRQLVQSGDQCLARSTTATPADAPCFSVGTVVDAHSTWLFYVAPEVRVGLPLGRHVELNLGVELPILIGLSRLRWGTSAAGGSPHLINAGPDGVGQFANEALANGSLVLFAPGVGARYDF